MPLFDAGSVVEPIHVRLMPYAEFDADIREPSDKQLGDFLAAINKLQGSGGLAAMGIDGGVIDTADPEAFEEQYLDITVPTAADRKVLGLSARDRVARIRGVSVSHDPDADPEAMLKAVDDLEPDKFVEVMTDLADMHSKLCSGKPSRAQILAVPIRRRFALYAYLQGEVMSPEAVPAAGGPQQNGLRLAAGQ